MCRVFLVEPPRPNIDLSAAREHGELHYIFDVDDRRASVFHSEQFGLDVLRQLEQRRFDPRVDCIAATGSLVPVAVALAAIVCRYPRVNVLFYSANESRYVKRGIGQDEWIRSKK